MAQASPLDPVVLVVDDDPGCLRAVRRSLEYAGMGTVAAADLAQAREALEKHDPACVIIEFRLPDGQGVEFLTRARESVEHLGRVMLTGVVDFLAVQEAVNQGSVHAFFTKPWDNNGLIQGVRGVIEQCRLARENSEMMRQLSDHNRALEATVQERTRQLEQAKTELEAVFDSWDEPMAIVDQRFTVLRANAAYSRQAGLSVREVPGRLCHEALFHRDSPCSGCPLGSEGTDGNPMDGRIEGEGHGWRIMTRPMGITRRPGQAMLCRYERAR